jgi:hypothetical protein
MTINILTGKVEKEVILPTGKPDTPHIAVWACPSDQGRHYLAGDLDMNKVSEYDDTGKAIWTVPGRSRHLILRRLGDDILHTPTDFDTRTLRPFVS